MFTHLKIFGIGLLFAGIVGGVTHGTVYLMWHTTIGVYIFLGIGGIIIIYAIGYLINEVFEIKKYDTKSFM